MTTKASLSLECPSNFNACKNGGTCLLITGENVIFCICSAGFTGMAKQKIRK